MEGRAAAPPGVFGTASPQSGGWRQHRPADCSNCTRLGGGVGVRAPQPTRPPDIQVFFNRKGKSTDVLKKLMEQNEKLDARGLPSWLAFRPSWNPGRAALARAGGPPCWKKHTRAQRKKLVLHSVPHPRTKRGVRVSPSPAGHATSDLGTGVGWFLGAWGGGFPEGGQSGNAAFGGERIQQDPLPALAPGRGGGRADRASISTQQSTGGRTWPWSD